MNLYECQSTHNGEVKTFIVLATSFAQAEQEFNSFTSHTLSGEYILNSITLSDKQIVSTSRDNTISGDKRYNRIGFNTDVATKQISTTPQQISDIVIKFM